MGATAGRGSPHHDAGPARKLHRRSARDPLSMASKMSAAGLFGSRESDPPGGLPFTRQSVCVPGGHRPGARRKPRPGSGFLADTLPQVAGR